MHIKTSVRQIKITPKVISKMASQFEPTGLDLNQYELIDDQNKVVGFQFFEDDLSIQKAFKQLENFPVLSSVKTDLYEKHVYELPCCTTEVSIFYSKENRGTFLVVSPYEGI